MDLQAEVVQALQLHLLQHMPKEPVSVMVEDITVNIVEDVAEGIVGAVAEDVAVQTEHLSLMILLLNTLM